MPKRVSPQETHDLLRQGYTYVDVRSEGEFEASHPEGAVNVPLLHNGPSGMTPNPRFLEAFERRFPKDARIVLGCAGGKRSMMAAEALEKAGYAQLIECRTGFGGARDASGRLVEPGWADAGLPIEQGAPEGRSWKSVSEGE